MSELGVFAVDRGIFTDPDFADEPFTEREAFMWLVSEAAWKDHARRGSAGRIELKRGEVCHSVRFMAEAWKWSKSRVDRFMKRAILRGMLSCENRDSNQVYLVCNYNKFQRVSLPEWDSSGTAAGQQRDRLEDRENIEDNISSFHSEIDVSKPKSAKNQNEDDFVIGEAFSVYNEYAELASWPKAAKLTSPRRSSMKARIAEAGGLDGWKAAMERAVKSPLLTGQNERGWRADLDFFLQAKSFTKLLEGSYDSRKPAGKSEIVSPAAAQSAVKAYWATFGIDRAIEADPGRKEDWKDLLTVWFEHEIWPNKFPNPKHPQCAIPKAMVQAFADKYGWEAPRYRKVETVAA